MNTSLFFITGATSALSHTNINNKLSLSIKCASSKIAPISRRSRVLKMSGSDTQSSSAAAPAKPQYAVTFSETDDKELSWLDPSTREMVVPSLQEKENMFVDALYAYYAGKPMLSNEDFDTLKDDLAWEGSTIVRLNREELTFLQAARAYQSGQPIMSDTDYDALRTELKKKSSIVALQTEPKCSLVTQTCWSDCTEDRVREFVLYTPAAGIAAIAWAVIAYEFTPLAEQPHVVSLAVGLPFIFAFAKIVTELVLPDPLILAGKCPSCAAPQRVYFGDVATVEGYKDVAECKCTNCEAQLTLDKTKRRFRLDMVANKSKKDKKKPAPPADE
eukprot:CAMPEP_0184699472 /NCGR_PEP_ID=MMETSP0313-20130426/5737_1 /TAXON_ID=2792 /ORGANISM="Porphyridium aerugineum, Strain SAG 1380-2" /LENGTH=330 /DNA_ID=CAMNT_0027158573 /DNA_START=164 /DNA_END=1156 /DNA_ORIENTATION=+